MSDKKAKQSALEAEKLRDSILELIGPEEKTATVAFALGDLLSMAMSNLTAEQNKRLLRSIQDRTIDIKKRMFADGESFL